MFRTSACTTIVWFSRDNCLSRSYSLCLPSYLVIYITFLPLKFSFPFLEPKGLAHAKPPTTELYASLACEPLNKAFRLDWGFVPFEFCFVSS